MNVHLYRHFTGRAEQERAYEPQRWIPHGVARLLNAGIPEVGRQESAWIQSLMGGC